MWQVHHILWQIDDACCGYTSYNSNSECIKNKFHVWKSHYHQAKLPKALLIPGDLEQYNYRFCGVYGFCCIHMPALEKFRPNSNVIIILNAVC